MSEFEISPSESQMLESTIIHYREAMERSPMVVGQVAISASREFGKNPLQEMQKIFDKHGIEIKLVSIPVESDVNREGILLSLGVRLPTDMQEYNVRMPHTGERDLPFWLWVTCHRQSEYLDLLQKLEVTHEENFIRLSQTGMASIKQGSEKSKILNAGSN